MNNSINFSSFTDVLLSEYGKEIEVHQSDFISRKKPPATDELTNKLFASYVEPENGS